MSYTVNWATYTGQGIYGAINSASDGTYLYVMNAAGGGLNKILLSNPNTVTKNFINVGTDGYYGITYYNGYLYLAGANDIISKWNASTGASVNSNWATYGVGNNTVVSLVNDGTYIYAVLGGGNMYRFSLSDGSRTPSGAWFTGVYDHAISLLSPYLYVSTSGNNIVRVNLSDASSTIIYSNASLHVAHGLGATSNYVYVSNRSSNAIDRYDLSSNTMNYNYISGATNDPLGICMVNPLNPYGTIYGFVCNFGDNTVTKFSADILVYPCFKRDTNILTNHGYIPVQKLRKGHLIKTLKDGYVPICMVGKSEVFHKASPIRDKHQLYKCSKSEYPELTEDLVMTGCHSILVKKFRNEAEREATIDVTGHTYVTDHMYRLPVCIDHRATVYETPGDYTIYHVALENEDYYANYGIYANGLLVESCSKRFLKELSGMKIISK